MVGDDIEADNAGAPRVRPQDGARANGLSSARTSSEAARVQPGRDPHLDRRAADWIENAA
jgi:hypothetical protein